MRRTLLLSLALLGLLAACSQPVPVQETLTVGGEASAPVTLPPGRSVYYRLEVGSDPVRVDAWATTNEETADLDLVVYNEERVPIAVADSRLYFHAPYKERVKPLSISLTPFWSVNLLQNTGTVYVEVKNQNPLAPVTVQAKAEVRGGPDPRERSCEAPMAFNSDTPGALLYLGQVDCYTYTGPSGATLTLSYHGPLDLRFKVISNDQETLLESGEEYAGLEPNDLVMVYSYRNRQIGVEAGFCASLPGCTDGIATGEYLLDLN